MTTDRDAWTLDAMEKYGGSFVKCLGELARRADSSNFARIKAAWPEYWADYEARGRQMETDKQNG